MKAIKNIFILFIFLFLLVSCCKKQVVKKEPVVTPPAQKEVTQPQVKEEPKQAQNITPVKPEPIKSIPMIHKVKKGECLWIISGYKDIYADPFMWPLIYKANKDKIKDPDLIFPGQIFNIDRDYSNSEMNKAIQFAKNRGKWSLWDGK